MGKMLGRGVGGWDFLKGGNNKNQDRVCGGISVVVGVLSKCEKVEKWENLGICSLVYGFIRVLLWLFGGGVGVFEDWIW